MNYFDYLMMTRKEDNKETFKNYLIDILDYDEDIATYESTLYYM